MVPTQGDNNLMEIINLTAHTINEVTTGNAYKTSGIVARVKSTTTKEASYDNCPIYKSVFGEIEGLPEMKEGIIYIVSSLALNAVPLNRTDVVAPGNLQRNEHGQPIGCVGFRTR